MLTYNILNLIFCQILFIIIQMEVIKNKARWTVYSYKCIKHYNVSNENIYDEPNEYPCLAVPQLVSDINGARIKFNFVYKKDCEKLLKAL